MTETKDQLQFTGRYGEKIKNVREIPSDSRDYMLITGTGVDINGQERLVMFEISRTTKKKNGKYHISSADKLPVTCNNLILMCEYKDDLLDGKEYVYNNGKLVVNTWKKGKQFDPDTTRNEQAAKAKEARRVCLNETVMAAIETGDPLNVRIAVTRLFTGNKRVRNVNTVKEKE